MLFEQLQAAVASIGAITDFRPQIGIITGTGLGEILPFDNLVAEIPYHQIPHMPTGAVQSHKHALQLGVIAGKKVAVFNGRSHYYEGFSMQEVTFATRLIKALGIDTLLLTNVSGSVQPHIHAGDLVILSDHINMLPEHPLRGENDDRLGIRFPDMSDTYDLALQSLAENVAQTVGIRVHRGVYLALQGPSLETPAEYRMARTIGADVIGMSTVPEVIVARHSGMSVLALSIASNRAWPHNNLKATTLEEVVATAKLASPKLSKVILGVLERL